MSKIKDHEKTLASFISHWQLAILMAFTKEGEEERDFFITLLSEYAHRVETMPKTYEQDGVDVPTAYLHYFYGNSHWYILERDSNPVQRQAYGFAMLNGDTENAEFGYIDIEELKASPAEIDLYFTPTPIAEIKESHGC